jgi:beta-galactosidase
MKQFLLFLIACSAAAEVRTLPDAFLFGASVYPELQNREEWNRMLDEFQKAKFNVVRVTESSWGNLEMAPGKYNFGWLKDFLDDLHKRGMKAVLGTSSYIAPQWLTARNPDTLVVLSSGEKIHPMARKAACLNHPEYRKAVRRFVLALGSAFKDHPAVIGWQLDNEIEFVLNRPCYSAACDRAWRVWLEKNYGKPAEFNRRLYLVSWGMQVDSFDDVPQPRAGIEGGPGTIWLPALSLANLHFRRDVILDFFKEQTDTLREAGVKQWITTDWNTLWTALADDPKTRRSLDIAGLNFYQPSAPNPDFWTTLAWHLDMHRSAHNAGHFFAMETRVGVAGDVVMWDPFPTKDQFRMWMLQPAAYGASMLMYWSGNRWRGGHWPHWGGVLDWTGKPEPDFSWLIELGSFFQKESSRLLKNPVRATAAVITDFDQRAALSVYKHVPSSQKVLTQVFDALHRSGLGADSLSVEEASKPARLKEYSLVVIPAATALDSASLPKALESFVSNGGNVIISPFTAYQDWDGVFRRDGFGANLASLTGVVVRTARRMGTAADKGREDHKVKWLDEMSPVGLDGYCEYMDVSKDAEVVGRFVSDEPVLNNQPAVTVRKLGKGSVWKLAFWPGDDSLVKLVRQLGGTTSRLATPLQAGLQAVPRTDGSLFIINTTASAAPVLLMGPATDRLSGRKFDKSLTIDAFGVLWLE